MRALVTDIARIDSNDITDADLDRYLDEGYSEVVSNREWPWTYSLTPETVTMVSGTDKYTLTSAVKRVVAVVETVLGYPLEMVSQIDWARRKDALSATTDPRIFVFTRGTLHLWPVPATTDDLDVYYYEHPAWGALDTDEPVFDSAFHTVLVDWALSRIWEKEEDFDRADIYRSKFEIKMSRMTRFYNTEMSDKPMIYGERPEATGGTNLPWLSDAASGGAV